MPTDPIKHVVVLMLENHSFDQMLGGLTSIIPEIDGVDPAAPGRNTDDGRVYSQQPTTEITVADDPKHEIENVLHQMENDNGYFVANYSRARLFRHWWTRGFFQTL
jgi:phospholipase C